MTLFVLLLLAVAGPAAAEVMDKEPSAFSFRMLAVVGGVLGIAAWSYRWWLGLLALALFAPLVLGFHFELTDPSVGPHIAREAGPLYLRQAYESMALFVLAHVIGLVLCCWRFCRRPKPVNRSVQPTGSVGG